MRLVKSSLWKRLERKGKTGASAPVAMPIIAVLSILGCSMQNVSPPESVKESGQERILPDIPPESDREVTPEMIEEYARIYRMSDLKVAEFYIKHPGYAESHPYNPTSEDIAFYERAFLEKVYPRFKELADSKGFMEARRIYMSNRPDGPGSRSIGSGMYATVMRELAAAGGEGASTGALSALLENDPAAVYYEKAMASYGQNRLDDAIKNMKAAVKVNQESPTLSYNLGMMYMERGRYADAIEFLEGTLNRINSTAYTRANLTMYAEVYMGASTNLGIVYVRVGVYDKAVQMLEQAIQFRPEDPDANINLGIAYYTMGDMDKAIEQMNRCVELDPGNASVHNLIGLIYYRRELYSAALKEFQTAGSLDTDNKQYKYNEGLALAKLGRYDEADYAFGKASGLREGEEIRREYAEHNTANKARELYNEGCAAMNAGDISTAVDRFEAALKLKPDLAEAHVNLGVCCRVQGDRQKQIHHFKEAIRLQPNMPDVHYNLGLAYSDGKMYNEAVVEFDEAIRLNPSFRDAHFKLGTVLYRTENFTDAAAEFQRCVELSPRWFEAYMNLGSCYLKTKNIDVAIEHFRKAVKLKPDSDEANYNLGIAYMKAKRYVEARDLFGKALEINPAHIQARAMLKELEE